ncbi:MAG TPA: hypothetical protein ENH85_02830 [Candidatus Scalindua sp.]|nr:hypothetical protein [Candidatus Scalindua sp.]
MVYIPLTPLKEETKIKNSLIPEGYISLSNQPKEYTDALQTKIGQDISNISDFDENAQESDIKDIWDAFHLGARNILHKSKQFFLSALPEMVFKNYEPGEGPLGLPYSEDARKKINERNEKLRKSFKEAYNKSDKQYKEWVSSNPQLQPRKEWAERGVLENIKENPKIFTDPAYWGFIAAESAAFSVGVIGTTLTVGAITKNPILAIGAGIAVATPLQTQDLFEDLVANGATEEQAAELSSYIGPVIASVEVAGDLPILKSLGGKVFSNILSRNIKKEAAKQVVKELTKKGLLKAGAITFTKIEVAETIEENLQLIIQNATVKTVNENRGILEGVPETTLRTLIATVPFALTGGGSAIRQEARVEDSKIEEPSVEEVSIEPKVEVEEKPEEAVDVPKVKPEEKFEVKLPEEVKSKSLIAISEMGRADIQLGKVLEEATRLATRIDRAGIKRIDGVKRLELEKELLKKANKELDLAQNKFYHSLDPKFKIGDIIDYQPKRSPEEIKVFGDEKIPIERIEITGVEFDMQKSADQMRRTGFPASFRFENLIGKNIKTGDEARLYPSYIINGEVLGETIGKKPEEVLKEFIALQKAPKISEVKPEPKKKPTPSEEVAKKKGTEPKKKVSKVARSIKAKAEEKGIVDAFKDLAEFTPVVIKEQTAKIQKIIDEDIEKAKRMAIGEQPLEEGIKGALLVKMVEDYAMDNKDGELILALANSPLVAETSVAGQTLRLIAERIPDSATAKIKEVEKERKKVAKKKLKGKTVKQVKAEIKQDLKGKLEKDSKKISKFSWQALINEVTC